jgi:UDP-2,3-diacylglucosamine pyrophosphatase LpxH
MAPPRSTAEDLSAFVQALKAHGTVSKAARALGMPLGTAQHQNERARALGLLDTKPQPSPRLPVTADECWAVLDHFIGRKRQVGRERLKRAPNRAEKRFAVAGDFHAPFMDNDVVATLIADEGPRTDTLIVSGDLMDFYSISRFLKYERVSIEQEIAATDALLGQLSAAFPDVLIVSGNHDSQRFEKQLRTLLAPEMMHVIELLTGGNLSVIHMLAKRYPNVRFAPQQAGSHSLGWMTQIGDLVVTHAEKYSRVPGAALRQIDEGLTDFDHVYALKPWRVLLQAHTHAASIIPWKADRLMGETGCCCITHGYQMTARMGGRPQRQGYVTLTQTGGVTDINSVRFRWLNAEKRVA